MLSDIQVFLYNVIVHIKKKHVLLNCALEITKSWENMHWEDHSEPIQLCSESTNNLIKTKY